MTLRMSEVLKEAAEHVEGGWCQGAYARDSEGFATDPTSSHADVFCGLGAVMRSSQWDVDIHSAATAYLCENTPEVVVPPEKSFLGLPSFVIYQDTPGRSKGEVLDVFRFAIKAALEDEAEEA